MGKGREANVIDEPDLYPTCGARDVERLLGRLKLSAEARNALVNLQARPLGVTEPDALRLRDRLELYVVGGRFRLLCGILESVSEAEKGARRTGAPAVDDSAELLSLAVAVCIERHTRGLHDMFKLRLDPRRKSVYLGDAMLVYLHQIYVAATLWGGAWFWKNHAPSIDAGDLVALGVAVSGTVSARDANQAGSDPDTCYDVRERFVLDAVRRFFSDEDVSKNAVAASFRQSVEMLAKVLKKYGPTAQFRGNVVERALLERLVALGKSGRCATVADLPFFPADAPADSPWRAVPFTATELRTSAEQKDVPAFLASPGAVGAVFSPNAQCRPDGVLMLPVGADGRRRALVLGSAVYSRSVTKAKDVSQFASTDMSRAYLSAAGREYDGAKARRQAWCEKGLHRTVAVRVHVSLPVAEKPPPTEQLYARETKVEGSGRPTLLVSGERPATRRQSGAATAAEEEDVVVNLDKSNVHLLLGKPGDSPELKALYDLLKVATRDEVGWPE